MTAAALQYLEPAPGIKLAYRKRGHGARLGLIWLGGFRSDMEGTKAVFLDRVADDLGLGYVRFDYRGHGASSGAFEDGTIGRWAQDAINMIDQATEGPQILVGSSMGGWIALMAALARCERVRALVLIAPAPDFTEDLMWARYPAEVRAQLERDGIWYEPSQYEGGPDPVTLKLIEDGRKHLLLRAPIPIACPVHILQGIEDDAVPWERALKLAERLQSAQVVTTLVKAGDHRLSTDDDLARLRGVIAGLV